MRLIFWLLSVAHHHQQQTVFDWFVAFEEEKREKLNACDAKRRHKQGTVGTPVFS
jgi:hypothetical protein